MSNRFEVEITNEDLREAVQPALNDAVLFASQHHYDRKGAVFAQIKDSTVTSDGLRITGAFLPAEYAERINAILGEYREAQQSTKD